MKNIHPEFAKGHKPQVFDDPALDQLHGAWLTLATELSVAFERIDTLERLLENRLGITRSEIENFEPDPAASLQRTERRLDIAHRLLRPFREFREAKINHASRTNTNQEK